jgi:hypothetical protein
VALALGGCASPLPGSKPPTILSPTPVGPPLTFGGRVLGLLDDQTVPDATVRIDLSQTLPCQREALGWQAWDADVAPNGTWGPVTIPRPNSNDVAFFLHANAPGYAERIVFIGAAQARGDIRNLTLALEPAVAVKGTAPAGTLLALAAPPFPRIQRADANGSFDFENAPATLTTLVAAFSPPLVENVQAPATLALAPQNGTAWTLEGRVVDESGTALPADVVAWNGTRLVGVARDAPPDGAFALPLPPHAADLRVDARTEDGHYGGTLALPLQGPPGTSVTITLRALC